MPTFIIIFLLAWYGQWLYQQSASARRKRKDCIDEYLHWANELRIAQLKVKEKCEGTYPNGIQPWADASDTSWISRDFPDNFEFRLKIEELKQEMKSEKDWYIRHLLARTKP